MVAGRLLGAGDEAFLLLVLFCGFCSLGLGFGVCTFCVVLMEQSKIEEDGWTSQLGVFCCGQVLVAKQEDQDPSVAVTKILGF